MCWFFCDILPCSGPEEQQALRVTVRVRRPNLLWHPDAHRYADDTTSARNQFVCGLESPRKPWCLSVFRGQFISTRLLHVCFFLCSFEREFFECSTELAMHSTHSHSIRRFVFHASDGKFSEKALSARHLHRPHEWKASARSPQWFTCSCYHPQYLETHFFQAFLVS